MSDVATLIIDAPKFKVKVRLGNGTPTPALAPGWELVERPKKKSFTRWSGNSPRAESVPVVLDGWANRESVERDLRKIERLAKPEKEGKDPPAFRVRGPIRLRGVKVVLETIDYGDAIRRRGDGTIVKQALTLGLRELQDDDRIDFRKQHDHGDDHGGDNTYTVKDGDTLLKIARKLKPNADRDEIREYARKIKKLNDLRDIRRELNPGRELKLP